ncbi:MAG: hypothetical protein NTU88_09335 [Armatimonadetes bacterium]|nr:hypothetical protein [Armatimonadota bacterium]
MHLRQARYVRACVHYAVRLYLRTGKLPGRKLGKSWRVLDSDVESWMIAGRSVRRAPFVSARGFLKRFPGRLSSADVIADKRAEAQLEDSHERRV